MTATLNDATLNDVAKRKAGQLSAEPTRWTCRFSTGHGRETDATDAHSVADALQPSPRRFRTEPGR